MDDDTKGKSLWEHYCDGCPEKGDCPAEVYFKGASDDMVRMLDKSLGENRLGRRTVNDMAHTTNGKLDVIYVDGTRFSKAGGAIGVVARLCIMFVLCWALAYSVLRILSAQDASNPALLVLTMVGVAVTSVIGIVAVVRSNMH